MDRRATVQPDHAVVFDLDGTLIDSAPDIHAAINRVMAEDGLSPLDLARVTSFIGNGVAKLVDRAYRRQGVRLSERDLTVIVKRFTKTYAADCATLTRPFPGVIDGVAALKRLGIPLGICTNKPHGLSERILDALGLAPFFDVVIGGDSCARRKPDPEPLLACANILGASPARTYYIGDSETDVQTARAAGVCVVTVTYGYASIPTADLGADATIDRIDHWASKIERARYGEECTALPASGNP